MSRTLRFALTALALSVGLDSTAFARPESVDWSEYLEPPNAQPMPVRRTAAPVTEAAADKPAKVKKAGKRTKSAKRAPAKSKKRAARKHR